MPHRHSDSFAWWRIVMSGLGPPSMTRLVLCGHFRFMDRDGTRCYASVRRLALDTGLNKDTVAAHRNYAITAGWLMVQASRGFGSREFCASLPDDLVEKYPKLLSDRAGELLSELARQAMHKATNRVSEVRGKSVRTPLFNCPSRSDIPPISLLTSENLGVDLHSHEKGPNEKGDSALHERLRSWLAASENVPKYLHDCDALARMAPPSCRFPGYEEVVRLWRAEHCKRS